MSEEAGEARIREGHGARPAYYVISYSIKDEEDVKRVKEDIRNNFIVILRITPLLEKGREATVNVVNQIYEYVVSIGGDIARLGEDRIIATPSGVKIWRDLGRK